MKKLPDKFLIHATIPASKGLSFCRVDVDSVRQWLSQLPIANHLKTAQLLYRATSELINLKVPVNLRITLIDTLAPAVYLNARQLQKNYLNRPLILSRQEQLIVNLHKQLMDALLQAYLSVIRECQLKMTSILGKPTMALTRSCIGALMALREYLTNNYLLYQKQDKHTWLNTHKIYQTALFFSIHDKPVFIDNMPAAVSAHKLYAELILWGSIKPEQLTQNDILVLFRHFAQLQSRVYVESFNTSHNAAIGICSTMDEAVVNPNQASSASPDLMLCIGDLLELFTNDPPKAIRPGLKEHLVSVWQDSKQRQFNRYNTANNVEICCGLSATHYFIRNKCSFSDWVVDSSTSDSATRNNERIGQANFNTRQIREPSVIDVWDSPFVTGNGHKNSEPESNLTSQTKEIEHQSFLAKTINTSAGGYCLELTCDSTMIIKAGEIIGVKSESKAAWSLATIRWIRHIKEQDYQIGVELICPTPMAFGAQIEQKNKGNESNFIRAILLPATELSNASLLLPSIGLKPNQSLIVVNKDKRFRVKLSHQIRCSGIFSQFNFIYRKVDPAYKLTGNTQRTSSLSLADD